MLLEISLERSFFVQIILCCEGAVWYLGGHLTASQASTHQMTVAPAPIVVITKMSSEIARCPLGSGGDSLRTTDSIHFTDVETETQ